MRISQTVSYGKRSMLLEFKVGRKRPILAGPREARASLSEIHGVDAVGPMTAV